MSRSHHCVKHFHLQRAGWQNLRFTDPRHKNFNWYDIWNEKPKALGVEVCCIVIPLHQHDIRQKKKKSYGFLEAEWEKPHPLTTPFSIKLTVQFSIWAHETDPFIITYISWLNYRWSVRFSLHCYFISTPHLGRGSARTLPAHPPKKLHHLIFLSTTFSFNVVANSCEKNIPLDPRITLSYSG